MKLSIITCTYNSEKYLQVCIDSVISQNLDIENYEHIFVDAYSTDSTKKIIKKYMKKYSNVKLIEHKPKWVYNAMNEGIKEAKWEYVLCLNSDDYLEKNCLNEYLDFINQNKNIDIFYGKLNFIKNNKIISIGCNSFVFLRKILFYHFGCNILVLHPTVIAKTFSLKKMWLFDESKKISSDFWMRLKMLKNGMQFKYFPCIVSNFRIHEWSISSNNRNYELWNIECKYFKVKYLTKFQRLFSELFDKLINNFFSI